MVAGSEVATWSLWRPSGTKLTLPIMFSDRERGMLLARSGIHRTNAGKAGRSRFHGARNVAESGCLIPFRPSHFQEVASGSGVGETEHNNVRQATSHDPLPALDHSISHRYANRSFAPES